MRRSWKPAGARSGAVMVAVLIGLLIIGLVSAAMARALVADSRQTQTQHAQLQAYWLSESGLQRAAQQLRNDPEFRGATWTYQLDESVSSETGRVAVSVEDGPEPSLKLIQATAYWPDQGQAPTTYFSELTLRLPNAGE